MAERPRLWGIDVIAAVYALATLALIWLIGNGSEVGRIAGIILAPFSASLSVGIFMRSNPIRVLILALAVIGLFVDSILVLYLLAGHFDFVSVPQNKDPIEELIKLPRRIIIALWLIFYLSRSDVKNAFRPR